MTGIVNYYRTTAALPVAASIVPVTTGLTSAIGANETQTLWFDLHFSVGAAGGVRALIAVPAGGAVFVASYLLSNTVAPAVVPAEQVASGTAFTNALANAGNHSLRIVCHVVNGATAGNVDLQMAQNTSDATAMTLLRGSSLLLVKG